MTMTQDRVVFPNRRSFYLCQKNTGSRNQSLSRLCVLMDQLAWENWKRWAVTGTDLLLSLAERDDRGALRSTVSGGWMATHSFKNGARRHTISKHFYMRVCILGVLEICEISLNHFFLIFTCDSPFSISAAENGLILRYTFKCSFSRSDGFYKRNIKAPTISKIIHLWTDLFMKSVILPGNTGWTQRTDFSLDLPQPLSAVPPDHLALTPSICSKETFKKT